MFHLRTHDGKEVDLLIEQEDGFYAFEIKQSEKIDASDARHLRSLESLLNKPLKKSFILSADPRTQLFHDGKVIAVHFAMFLG
jgi:predicted AAA+ superfamily ATPase